jgi:hypothetical protein
MFEELDEYFMIRKKPGVLPSRKCWTGKPRWRYLLQASFSTAIRAAREFCTTGTDSGFCTFAARGSFFIRRENVMRVTALLAATAFIASCRHPTQRNKPSFSTTTMAAPRPVRPTTMDHDLNKNGILDLRIHLMSTMDGRNGEVLSRG